MTVQLTLTACDQCFGAGSYRHKKLGVLVFCDCETARHRRGVCLVCGIVPTRAKACDGCLTKQEEARCA